MIWPAGHAAADGIGQAPQAPERMVRIASAEPAAIVSDPGGFLEAPAEVTVGERFEVFWAEPLHTRDRVTLVPAGADGDAMGSRSQRSRVRDNISAGLVAPAAPGHYEVRYVSRQDGLIAGVPVEVVDTSVTLDVPAEVTVGERFEVFWDNPIHTRDRVTLVARDADDDARGSRSQRARVRDNTSATLVAPSEPGEYEVRYQLNQERRVMGRAPIRVVDASVSLDAPSEVVVGARFEVFWDNPIHSRDRVTLVAREADDDARGSRSQRARVRSNTSATLVAPSEPGEYELRYQLNQNREIMGRLPVTVLDARVGVAAPAVVAAGERFDVRWSEPIHSRDRVAIVPADAAEDASGSRRQRTRVRNNTTGSLTAPSEAGDYEVRYQLNQDRRVMGRAFVEVVPRGTAIPETAAALHDPGPIEILMAGAEPTAPSVRVLPDERQLMLRIGALGSAESADVRVEIIEEIITYGEPVIEIVIELRDDGLLDEADAELIIAGIEDAPAEAATPEQPADTGTASEVSDGASIAEGIMAAVIAADGTASYADVSVADDVVTITGFSAVGPDGEALEIDTVIVSGPVPREEGGFTAESVHLEGGRLADEDGSLTWRTGLLEGVSVPAPDEIDDPAAPMARLSLTDIAIEPAELADPIEVAAIELRFDRVIDDVPHEVFLAIERISMSSAALADQPEQQAMLEAMGYDRLNVDLTLDVAYDGEIETVDVRGLTIGADNVGQLSLSGRVADLALDKLQDGGALEALLESPAVELIEIRFDNAGIVERAMEMQAQEEGLSVADFQSQSLAELSMMLSMIGNPAFEEQVAASVGAFMEAPRSLRISARPSAPVKFMQIFGVAMAAPQSIPDVLGIEITAND